MAEIVNREVELPVCDPGVHDERESVTPMERMYSYVLCELEEVVRLKADPAWGAKRGRHAQHLREPHIFASWYLNLRPSKKRARLMACVVYMKVGTHYDGISSASVATRVLLDAVNKAKGGAKRDPEEAYGLACQLAVRLRRAREWAWRLLLQDTHASTHLGAGVRGVRRNRAPRVHPGRRVAEAGSAVSVFDWFVYAFAVVGAIVVFSFPAFWVSTVTLALLGELWWWLGLGLSWGDD